MKLYQIARGGKKQMKIQQRACFTHAAETKGLSAGHKTRRRHGGTLVEVVVSTCILSVLGAGIMGSTNYGMFMMRNARENARATQVILEKMESVRLYNWSEVTSNGFVPVTFTDYYDPQAPTNAQGAVYNGTISVTNVPFSTSYNTNMRMFQITLQWNTAGCVNHTRNAYTYIAKDGLQNYVY